MKGSERLRQASWRGYCAGASGTARERYSTMASIMALKQIFHAKPLPLCPPTGLLHKSCLAPGKRGKKARRRPFLAPMHFICCIVLWRALGRLLLHCWGCGRAAKSSFLVFFFSSFLLHAANPTLLRVATNSTVNWFEKAEPVCHSAGESIHCDRKWKWCRRLGAAAVAYSLGQCQSGWYSAS